MALQCFDTPTLQPALSSHRRREGRAASSLSRSRCVPEPQCHPRGPQPKGTDKAPLGLGARKALVAGGASPLGSPVIPGAGKGTWLRGHPLMWSWERSDFTVPPSRGAGSLTSRPAPSEDDALDGHTLRSLPGRVDDGALAGGGAEPRVGVSARFPYNRQRGEAPECPAQPRSTPVGWGAAGLPAGSPSSGVQSLFFHEVTLTPGASGWSMPSQ